jgi:hypothetical protein
MNAAEVMSALSAHDASVVIEGERIRVLHPAGHPPPPELLDAARQNRAALRTLLEGERENITALPMPRCSTPCAPRAPNWLRPIVGNRQSRMPIPLSPSGAPRHMRWGGRHENYSACIRYHRIQRPPMSDWHAMTPSG